MQVAEKILKLIEAAPVTPEQVPVIFNGLEPRYLGNAKTLAQADLMLLENNISATYVSKALVHGKHCIIAHG